MSASPQYMKEWRAKNAEHVREYSKAYGAKHLADLSEKRRKKLATDPAYKSKSKQWSRNWYLRNKAIIDVDAKARYHSEWRKRNLEKLNAYKRAWNAKNGEKRRLYYRRHFAKHTEKVQASTARWRKRVGKQYFQEWEKKNPGKRLAYSNARRARIAKATLDDSAKAFYCFVRSQKFVECSYCGTIVSGKSAHIDHLVALSRGGMHIASNLRTSCKTCNLSKHCKSIDEWKPTIKHKEGN